MEGIINSFSINLQESYFIKDYKNFYKRTYLRRLAKLVLALLASIVLFLFIKYFTDWIKIEPLSFALIFLILNFVLFNAYNLYSINKKIKSIKNEIKFEKMNLLIKNNQIEIHQYGYKKIIFLSQLKECLLISNSLFFIENNKKHLPIKVNKSEMSENSFENLIKELEAIKINVIK